MLTHQQILDAYLTDHKGGWDERFTNSAKVRFLQFFPRGEWARFGYLGDKLEDPHTPFASSLTCSELLCLTKQNVIAEMAKDLAYGFSKCVTCRSSPLVPCMLLGMWLWILDDTFATDTMSQNDRCSEKLMFAIAERYNLPKP